MEQSKTVQGIEDAITRLTTAIKLYKEAHERIVRAQILAELVARDSEHLSSTRQSPEVAQDEQPILSPIPIHHGTFVGGLARPIKTTIDTQRRESEHEQH